jgi:hypothetical protein
MSRTQPRHQEEAIHKDATEKLSSKTDGDGGVLAAELLDGLEEEGIAPDATVNKTRWNRAQQTCKLEAKLLARWSGKRWSDGDEFRRWVNSSATMAKEEK